MCGQPGGWAEMFGMTLFPALDVEPFEQWYVHPRCVSRAVRADSIGPLRDEIKDMWPDEYDGDHA